MNRNCDPNQGHRSALLLSFRTRTGTAEYQENEKLPEIGLKGGGYNGLV